MASNKIRRMNQNYAAKADDYMNERLGMDAPSLDKLYQAFQEIERQKKKSKESKGLDDLDALLSSAPKAQPKQTKVDDGETGVLDFLGGSVKNAFQGFNPLDDVSMKQAFENQMGMLENPSNSLDQLNRTATRGINSATLGGLELADKKLNNRDYEYLQNKEGFDVSDLGSFAGYFAPGALAANALRGTRLGAKVSRNMPWKQRAGQYAKEGAVVGGMLGAAETGIDELTNPDAQNWQDHLKRIGLDASIGAIADPLVGLGLDKLLKPKNVTMNGQTMDDFLGNIGNYADTSTTGRADPVPDPLGLNSPLSRPKQQKQSPILGLEDNSIPKMDSTPYGDIPLTETRGNGLPRSHWENRLNEFSRTVQGANLPPGREKETLEEMWSHFAEPNEPKLEDVVDLATPSLDEVNQYSMGQQGEPLKFKQTKVGRPPQETEDFLNFTTRNERPFSTTRVEGNYRTEPTNSGVRVSSSPSSNNRSANLEDFNITSAQASDDLLSFLNQSGKGEPLGATAGTATMDGMRGIDIYGQSARVKDKKESVLGKVWNTFQREASDERVYAKKIENEITGSNRFKSKGPLFQKLTNMSGASGAAEHKLMNELLPSLDNLRGKGKKVADGFEYRIAKHLQNVRANNPNYTLPKGMDDQQLQNIVQTFERDPDFQQFNNEITKYFDSLLDSAVEKGQLSADARKTLQTKYPDYFPLFRVKDLESSEAFEQAFNNAFGFTSGGRKDPIKSLQDGSDEPIADPIESLVKYTENMMYSTFRNDALRELDRLAKFDKKGKWVRKDPKGKTDNEVTFRVNGKDVKYYVSKDFKEALDVVNDAGMGMNFASNLAYSLAKAQRLAITGNPTFVVFRSLLRDIPQSWKSSRAGFNVFDLYNATLDLFTNGKALGNKSMLDEFYLNGAGVNTIWANDSKEFQKFRNMAYKGEGPTKTTTFDPVEKKTAKKFAQLLDNYRTFIVDNAEQIPKMAEYRASRRKGKDQTESAFNARTILDYNKAGRSTKRINKYAAFINTTIRGRDKYVDSLVERPLQTLAKTATFSGGMSALAYWATNEFANDEQRRFINEAPDWMKDTYWLFPSPKGNEVIKFPKPFESAALVSTPLENYFRYAEGKNVDVKNEVRDWVKDNILIDPSLTPFTPFVEAQLNRDGFTGRPIVDENKKPIDQRNVYTSGIAKATAEGLDNIGLDNLASPKKIDHIIQGLFPVTGQNVTQMADRRLADLGLVEKPNYPEGTYQSPVESFATGGPLREKLDGRTSASVGKFYEVDNKLREIRDKRPDLFNEDLYGIVNRAIKRSNDISSKINQIRESDQLNPKQKKEMLNPLVEERNKLIRLFEDKGVYKYVDQIYKDL